MFLAIATAEESLKNINLDVQNMNQKDAKPTGKKKAIKIYYILF